MAGDWIKMRGNLWDDPRVARLCDLVDAGEAAVIGGLYWLWATADQHSEDGVMPGLTLRSIDRKTGLSGFGDALVVVGWLADHPEGVRICHFEEHNGTSAKARMMTAKRVAEHKANAKVTLPPLPEEHKDVTEPLPREEKRREEIKKELKSKAETATAMRLPAEWQPTLEDIAFCKTSRPELRIDEVQERFRDHWISTGGVKGRKLDWSATWRNWVRNERGPPNRSPVARPEKFDPTAYVNRNRKIPDERTIDIDATGEPILQMVRSAS